MTARRQRINRLLMSGLAVMLTAILFTTARLGAQPDPVTLTVNTRHVVREGADRFVGINLNYLRDHDANRPGARPLDTALAEMGTRWLRYPGGEKSNFYRWSEPPYTHPLPVSLGWYRGVKGQRMDFDQYVACTRKVGAEAYIVVGYSTEKASGLTETQWLESAAAWVRYANKVKKYGVRYWEIGNENWNSDKGTPEEMARIVTAFSRAMKAVDPTIKIGASGNSESWWKRFLPGAASSLDFLTLSVYNCWDWKGYEHFVSHPNENTVRDVDVALAAIGRDAPAADRARLQVIVAETNSKDYSENGWPGTNTLGHTLVTFDTLGQIMARPNVLSAMVWTTRWVSDAEAAHSQWYGLGPTNALLPTGRAVALWGQFVQKKMVGVTGGNAQISGYASCSDDGKSLAIWIVNRSYQSVNSLQVEIDSPRDFSVAGTYCLSGTGPEDASPNWGKAVKPSLQGKHLTGLTCPAVSVTVITLHAKHDS